jgi:hypothetical protein
MVLDSSDDEPVDTSNDKSVDTMAGISTSKVEHSNHIVHYPSLVPAVKAIGSCRCCITNDLESFFMFCDEKCDPIHYNSLRKRN